MQLARQPGGAEGAGHDDTRRARIAATAAAPVSRPPTASTLTQPGSPPPSSPGSPAAGLAPPLGGESAESAPADSLRRRGRRLLRAPSGRGLAVPRRSSPGLADASGAAGRCPASARCCRRTGCRRRWCHRAPAGRRRRRDRHRRRSPPRSATVTETEGGARGRGDARRRLAVLALPGERDVAAVGDLQRADTGAGVGPGPDFPSDHHSDQYALAGGVLTQGSLAGAPETRHTKPGWRCT